MTLYLELETDIINSIFDENETINHARWRCIANDSLSFSPSPLYNKYYKLSKCKPVFSYLDSIESKQAKDDTLISWEWGGVRCENSYYITIHAIARNETEANRFLYLVEGVLGGYAESYHAFEYPDIEYLETPDIEYDIEEDSDSQHPYYNDDDATIRLLEKHMGNLKSLQWERPYPEFGGSGDFSVSLLTSVSAGIVLKLFEKLEIKVKKSKMEKRRRKEKRRIEAKLQKVVSQYKCKGVMEYPSPGSRLPYDATFRTYGYLFTETLSNGNKRLFFAERKGNRIRKL